MRGLGLSLLAAALALLPPAWAQESDFDGYTMLDLTGLKTTRASSVLALLDSFVPTIEEPLPTRLLTIDSTGDGEGLVVIVETRGYLDDSIAGENFRARLAPDGDGWRLMALGRQVVCARGPQAGEPAEICP